MLFCERGIMPASQPALPASLHFLFVAFHSGCHTRLAEQAPLYSAVNEGGKKRLT